VRHRVARVHLRHRAGAAPGQGLRADPEARQAALEDGSESYQLEYGTDRIEIHLDACKPGQGLLLVDDLLATGGTMEAALKLVRRIGGKAVAAVFVIELGFLGGPQASRRPARALLDDDLRSRRRSPFGEP
jgi:hypothetical protein